jgi:hypothetical protein
LTQDVINCPRCRRRTSAARGACIYCGETLPITQLSSAPPQRNLDAAEHAYNTILEPPRGLAGEAALAALSAALKIEASEAGAMIAANKRLPVARSQTRQEAEMIAALVRGCGLAAFVVADEELAIERELTRARRITINDGELALQHTGGALTIAVSDIKLIVLGLLRQSRVDYSEGLSGMRTQSANVLDTAEFRSDETLLDVYSSSLDQSFRLRADSFDYSGLVRPLSFRAELNFRAVLRVLEEAASLAVVDRDFARIRRLLGRAWPERTHNEARGLKRTGIAYRPVALSSLTTDNRDQFERYSRLMFLSVTRNLGFRAQ